MSETLNSKYFVTGGGTGGHIYPAMAVADLLAAEGAKVYYVGNKRNMEFENNKKKGYKTNAHQFFTDNITVKINFNKRFF